MPTVLECLAHAQWLASKGRGNEPAKLVLPKLEAQRRRANKEQLTRVQWDEDPQGYKDWWEQISRYRDLVGNNTLASHVMVEILKAVADKTIKDLGAAHDSQG